MHDLLEIIGIKLLMIDFPEYEMMVSIAYELCSMSSDSEPQISDL